MAEQITWVNETHWRTSDIQRIVRLAMAEAGAEPSESRVVQAIYTKPPPKTKKKPSVPAWQRKKKRKRKRGYQTKPSVTNITFQSVSTRPQGDLRFDGKKVMTLVTLHLPKRGSSSPHPVAMVALAANRAVAGKVDEDATLLAFSDVYFMANYLAAQFAAEAVFAYEDEDGSIKAKHEELRGDLREITPPTWADPSKLYIAKYKDPLKDQGYLDFIAKKETAIKRDTTTIARLEKEIKAAERKLRDAKRRKKAAEKAIKDATERRTT